MEPSEMMTPREAAGFLRISLRTLYRLLHEDDIRGVKVGGQWRIPRNELESYVRRKGD
jgi:excisionase family DNA binding protein